MQLIETRRGIGPQLNSSISSLPGSLLAQPRWVPRRCFLSRTRKPCEEEEGGILLHVTPLSPPSHLPPFSFFLKIPPTTRLRSRKHFCSAIPTQFRSRFYLPPLLPHISSSRYSYNKYQPNWPTQSTFH